MREELGIKVTSAQPRRREVVVGADLTFWVVDGWTGTPANFAPEEHDRVAWFTLHEAKTLALADAFYPAFLAEVLRGHA